MEQTFCSIFFNFSTESGMTNVSPRSRRMHLLSPYLRRVIYHLVLSGGAWTWGEPFMKVLQKMLQKVAEEVLPDSQCGYSGVAEDVLT